MSRSTIIIAAVGCVLLFTIWIWTGEDVPPAVSLDESATRSAAAKPAFPKSDRPRSLLDRSRPREGVDGQGHVDGDHMEGGDVVARSGVEPRPGGMNDRRAARRGRREARLEAKRAQKQADGQHAGVVRQGQGQGQLSRRDEPDAMAKVEQPPLRQPEAMDDEFDEDSLEHLRDVALGDPDPDERADALSQLDLEDPEAMDVLVKALEDSDTDVRLAALDELWTNSDEPPLEILARVMHDTDPEVRLEAVRILAESEEPYAQQLLRTALMDRDEDVREEASDALED